jgi:hypothetical protein
MIHQNYVLEPHMPVATLRSPRTLAHEYDENGNRSILLYGGGVAMLILPTGYFTRALVRRVQ